METHTKIEENNISEADIQKMIRAELRSYGFKKSDLTAEELEELREECTARLSGMYVLDGVLFYKHRFKCKEESKKRLNKILSAAKAIKTILILIVATLFIACGNREIKVEDRAIVTIAPLKPLVESILGDDFEVSVLVPQGASPETFEPTPKQLREVESARFVFGTGLLDFEQELLHRIARNEQIINLSQGIELIAGTCSHAHHGHTCSHAHGIDPHIWCSPKSLGKMADNMYNAIAREMPDSANYDKNYTTLCIRMLELDEEVAEACRQTPRSTFIIYHPALTYLARDYGLTQVAVEHEGKEPSAKHLAKIIEQARAEGVKHIFYQSEFPASSVEVICKDIGATAVEINPLDEEIFANIRNIVTLITE